jgi:hypothetical protein
MARLTDNELAIIVLGSGWTGRDAAIAFSVAKAESGGITDRVGIIDHDDLGLFQINRRYHPEVDRINWRNGWDNARLAHDIWSRRGWGEWNTFKNGSYLRFMGSAEAAIKANPGGTIPLPGHPGLGSIPGAEQFSNVLDFLNLASNRNTWIRIGEVAAGILMVGFGLVYFAKPTVKPIVGAVAKATPVGKAVGTAAKAVT